jgi:hypothetical protein
MPPANVITIRVSIGYVEPTMLANATPAAQIFKAYTTWLDAIPTGLTAL